ncbi:MAG: hypothetical protein AAF907_18145 [Planctomycetota bacterium]
MNPTGELEALLGLFPDGEPLVNHAAHVPAGGLPPAYKMLLAHDQHMTVTMEAFHGSPVTVDVEAEKYDDAGRYCRRITLACEQTARVVQFGVVRFDFSYVTDAVREEIVGGRTPLGRVLIRHNVLRHIDLGAILSIECGPGLASRFGCGVGTGTHGRLATIFCDGKPAVDLLEIAAPVPTNA